MPREGEFVVVDGAVIRRRGYREAFDLRLVVLPGLARTKRIGWPGWWLQAYCGKLCCACSSMRCALHSATKQKRHRAVAICCAPAIRHS